MESPADDRKSLQPIKRERLSSIADIRLELARIRNSMTLAAPEPRGEDLQYLTVLRGDTRKGIVSLLEGLRKQVRKLREERKRLLGLYALEEDLRRRGFGPVCGIDEAGRGPLAGPVVAAAVILPAVLLLPGIDDSKRLNAAERERILAELLRTPGVQIGVGMASHRIIDRVNILAATMLAMREAVADLPLPPRHALVDGMTVKGLALPQTRVVGGDARCASIACASIVAKVVRDRMMKEASRYLPDWHFDVHKGYGTGEHMEKLRRDGPSILHRLSFGGVKVEA